MPDSKKRPIMHCWAHNMSFDVEAAAGFAYQRSDNPGHHDLTISPNLLVRSGPMVSMVSGSFRSSLLTRTSFNMLSSLMVQEPYMWATWSTPYDLSMESHCL